MIHLDGCIRQSLCRERVTSPAAMAKVPIQRGHCLTSKTDGSHSLFYMWVDSACSELYMQDGKTMTTRARSRWQGLPLKEAPL